jgi:hypothetical protein
MQGQSCVVRVRALALRAIRLGLFLGLLWGLLGGVAGCTSEEANPVGADLEDLQYDGLLDTLRTETLDSFGNLAVIPTPPYAENEVLYFGRRGTESSSMLLRYDFSQLPDTTFVDGMFTLGNIRVELFLYMLDYYTDVKVGGVGLIKTYQVSELAAPLDESLYPGPRPAVLPGFLNATPFRPEPVGSELFLQISAAKFLEWYEAGGHNGIMVSEGETGEEVPGFIGFASKEMTRAATVLQKLREGTLPFPVLKITFTEPDTFLRMVPIADTATLEALDPIPGDSGEGIVLRTHLRSYPYLSFDLGEFPAGVFVNHAVLSVVNDTLQGYGPLESIVAAEVSSSFLDTLSGPVALETLGKKVNVISGRRGLDPTLQTRINFDVTSMVQRRVNGIFSVPVRIMLLGPEDFFPNYDTGTLDPDYFLKRFRFYGSGAEPSLRPYLKVTYTRIDALSGGRP